MSNPLQVPTQHVACTVLAPGGGDAPLIRAPEKVHAVFRTLALTACIPLLAGVALFGWRAMMVSIVSVASCVLIQRVCCRLTHTPSRLATDHAVLTGVLLAMTLPAFTPYWLIVLAAVFAIVVGKQMTRGTGHVVWVPALVGRFAVAILAPILCASGSYASLEPAEWPVLSRGHVVFGDVEEAGPTSATESIRPWTQRYAPEGKQALLAPRPTDTLSALRDTPPAYSAIGTPRTDTHRRQPVLLSQLPPIGDILFGCYGGAIGQTSAIALLVAGLFMIYRNYIGWTIPLTMLASAALVAAVAPVQLAGPGGTAQWIWGPICNDGGTQELAFDAGILYVLFQVLSGGLMLGAFFLATEMSARPITARGQCAFGLFCGTAAMTMQLYVDIPVPTIVAILLGNTLTPLFDRWQKTSPRPLHT